VKKPILVLTGPTAVGKTEISIKLAQRCGGEIISADSMQVYRQMDIGTAKIRPEEMQGIPHYLIDEFNPDEEFNVYVFQKKGKEYIKEIHERGKLPILVGGTGFYIQSILYDIDFTENQGDDSYRRELQKTAESEGVHVLHEKLRQVDAESAAAIHENNVKRVIRALEYFHFTGEKFSAHNEEQRQKTSPYQFLYAVLSMNRQTLYERIDTRVDLMMKEGLAEEVEWLLRQGYDRSLVSMQGLGYKEIAAAIQNEITMDEAVYQLKRGTRHFAKRQMTWFRREREVCVFDKEKYSSDDEIVEDIIKTARERGVLS
jgi:tRNA dimethylallyltransferase